MADPECGKTKVLEVGPAVSGSGMYRQHERVGKDEQRQSSSREVEGPG